MTREFQNRALALSVLGLGLAAWAVAGRSLKLAGELASQAGMTSRAERYLQNALTFGGDDSEVQLALDQVRRNKRS